MTKKIIPVAESESMSDNRISRRVTRKVSILLEEIEKEPVPDRLMELAVELQKALGDRSDEHAGR